MGWFDRFKPKPKPTGKIHDYTGPGMWGWSAEWELLDEKTGTIKGHLWGAYIDVGDHILVSTQRSHESRFLITEVRHVLDPNDMHFFTARYDPEQS